MPRYYMRADLAAVLYTRSNRDTRFTCRQCSRGLRRRCQSTTHRPLKSRCGSIQVLTQHGSDAGNMLRQYAPTRVPQSHTALSTHLVSRTLKCARDMSHFSQEEMQLARARCGRRVIARARQSQHEPGACADSNRGHRPHRPRRPGRSDGRDDFTRIPSRGNVSV